MNKKTPYIKPKLEVYGSIKKITKSKESGSEDSYNTQNTTSF
jgi:hypothetical protein